MAYNVISHSGQSPLVVRQARDSTTIPMKSSSLSIFEDPAQIGTFQWLASRGDGTRPEPGTYEVEVLSWNKGKAYVDLEDLLLIEVARQPASAFPECCLAGFGNSSQGSRESDV